MIKTNIKFYIPFEGFYDSIYQSVIDEIISNEIDEGYLTEEQSKAIDYQSIFEAMAVEIFDKIVELFNDEFDIFTSSEYIIYDGLYSPKYYNYSTDKIKATIYYNNYSKIYGELILNDEFIEYVNEASKSRDGFASFYEGIEEVSKEPSIFLEYLFQWFTLHQFRDEVISETCENIHETIYNNLNC